MCKFNYLYAFFVHIKIGPKSVEYFLHSVKLTLLLT